MTADNPRPNWAKLRQAVVAVPEVATASAEARKEFGLAPGFADPLLADIGMEDESIILGDSASFLEFVGPMNSEASVHRWLDKAGPGGYALSIQVGALAPFLERAAAAGVATVADMVVYGHRIVQFHPKKVGLLLELDEIPDPAEWFWDDVEKELPTAPHVDSFEAIEVTSPDPEGQADLWAAIFGVDVERNEGKPQIRIGDLTARFVAGDRQAMTGVDLRRSAGSGLAPGVVELSGVRFQLI